jgi:hypothetical protein
LAALLEEKQAPGVVPQINRLQVALRAHLPWHGARLTFLALFLVALFRVETLPPSLV